MLTACGKKKQIDADESDGVEESSLAPNLTIDDYAGSKYYYDGGDMFIKSDDMPSKYVLIPIDTFKDSLAQFKLDSGKITTESTYEDICHVFGDEGIYMTTMSNEDYKYFAWYSDKEFQESHVSIIVVFKPNNDTLTYYSYTLNGITMETLDN